MFCLQFTDEYGLLPDFQENMKWVWDVDYEKMLGQAEYAFATFEAEDEV